MLYKNHICLNIVLMYEMTSDGKSEYQSRTLRELLNYVNIEAKTIDSQSNSNSKRFSEDIIEHSAVSELRLRDLRRLDYQFNPNEEKSVLVRRHAVLFAMDPLRAVVMYVVLCTSIVICEKDLQLFLFMQSHHYT